MDIPIDGTKTVQERLPTIQELAGTSTPLNITPNQLKVMENKYLRGDDPRLWARRVARNIAYADLLYLDGVSLSQIFAGVSHNIVQSDFDARTRLFLLHKGIATMGERTKNFRTFLENLDRVAATNPVALQALRATEEKFYQLLTDFDFLPNSPTLMNAGRDLQQLSACYVLPVDDSIEGIYDSVKHMAIIHQSGGGTGFCFSNLRPAGDTVKSTKGIASGPMSFMRIFDTSTDVVKQGGTRRGANMGIMHWKHPDIRQFITLKSEDDSILTNFNVSVALDDEFMQAAAARRDVDLVNPRTGEVLGTDNAGELFDLMADCAWKSGDPGFVVIDRINNSDSNTTPHVGRIESTNPCVTGDTLVSTSQGLVRMDVLAAEYCSGGVDVATDTRVPVEVLHSDGTVSLLQQESVGVVRRPLCAAFSTGVKDVFKITTASGYSLKATADHKVFTDSGWKTVADLDGQDTLFIQSAEGFFGEELALPCVVERSFVGGNGRTYTYNFPTEWSFDLGTALGWLVGDGWLRSGDKNCRVGFVFNREEDHILAHLKDILNSYYGSDIKDVRRENGTTHLSYHSKYFVDFFERLGVKAVKAGSKAVPWSLFGAPREAVVGFLQALFTADGTISTHTQNDTYYVRLTAKSRELLEGVQLLLLQLGIKAKVYDRCRAERICFTYTTVSGKEKSYTSDGVCYELHIGRDQIPAYLSTVGFLLDKHSTKVDVLASRNYYSTKFYDAFVSREYVGREQVYDLQEPLTHSFIANGLVVHNCGEQPLLSYEPCNLGSINLSRFVVAGAVDWERLGSVVDSCVHFLDNVIDMNNYPLAQIEVMAKGNRRIGLGVMGWAEMLVGLGVGYDTDEAVALGEQVMGFINKRAMQASEQMAATRGLFFNWKGSVYDESSEHYRNIAHRPRNSARTTIAPTGTIAVTAGLQGSGIEPFFAIAYKRFQAEAVDALKRGEEPDSQYVYYEAVSSFLAVAESRNWFGVDKDELLAQISDNHGSVQGISAVPLDVQKLFISSHDVSWKRHIDHQAAFQRHINNAVSKTINMAHDVTVQDIKDAYLYAYNAGCKGVTVYRDGCKSVQVLSTGKTEVAQEEEQTVMVNLRRDVDLSGGSKSDYYEIATGYGTLHVNIVYDEQGPFRMFVSLPPIGTEISGLASILGIFMSKAFQSGYDPRRAIKHLNSVKGDKPFGYGPNRVDSIPHAMAIALKRHLEKTDKLAVVTMKEDEISVEVKSGHCPKCYSPNIKYLSGCSGPTCFDCGYAECS